MSCLWGRGLLGGYSSEAGVGGDFTVSPLLPLQCPICHGSHNLFKETS